MVESRVLRYGGDQDGKLLHLTPTITYLLDLCDGTLGVNQIARSVSDKYPSSSPESVLRAIDRLIAEGLLEDPSDAEGVTQLLDTERARYARQIALFGSRSTKRGFGPSVQRRIKESSVLLVGCGGVGSHTAMQLSALGIGELRIVDFDVVEESNLNRTFLYRALDVGAEKARTAESRLSELNPHVRVVAESIKVGSVEDIELQLDGIDFAVLCADSPYWHINEWFNSACLRRKIPYSLAGTQGVRAAIGPMTVPGVTSCFTCQRYDPAPNEDVPAFVKRSNAERVAPTAAPMIAVVAAVNAWEIVKYLGRFDDVSIFNKRAVIDFSSFSIDYEDLPMDDDCPDCGNAASSKARQVHD